MAMKPTVKPVKVSTTSSSSPSGKRGMDISAMGAVGNIRSRGSKIDAAENAALGLPPKQRR